MKVLHFDKFRAGLASAVLSWLLVVYIRGIISAVDIGAFVAFAIVFLLTHLWVEEI